MPMVYRGTAIIFARIVRPLTVFTQRNFVADFLQAKWDFRRKTAVFRFWEPCEYRFKIGDFSPTGAGWPKISDRRGRSHQPFSSHQTRLNDLSYGIKIWTDLSSVVSQARVWQTVRRTYGPNSFSRTASGGVVPTIEDMCDNAQVGLLDKL